MCAVLNKEMATVDMKNGLRAHQYSRPYNYQNVHFSQKDHELIILCLTAPIIPCHR